MNKVMAKSVTQDRRKRKVHPWYKFSAIDAYNATINFIVGGRGLGKTYGAKKKCITNFIKRGEQFIYLRRYTKELSAARATFFADIAREFPDWDFKLNGTTAVAAPASTRDEKKRQWAVMGFFVALATQANQRSVSFDGVNTILFDEFIIEKGVFQYLQNEVKAFLNFYSTVDRNQDKTKVYLMANSVSIDNPYFIYWEIRPDEVGEFVVKGGGYLVAHFPNAEEFAKSVLATKFGKFIEGSEFADMAVNNIFDDNHDELVKAKTSRARYMFTLETKHGMFSVWHDMFDSEYYIQAKLPKVQPNIYTLIPGKMTADKELMTFSDRPLSYLRGSFKKGKVTFDKPSTRNTFVDIFKR